MICQLDWSPDPDSNLESPKYEAEVQNVELQ
jgi:hypothetical protein